MYFLKKYDIMKSASTKENNMDNSMGKFMQRKIFIKPYDRMIEDIIKEIGTKIILDPDYQRNYIWGNDKASKLVESILLNIPIPVIYASEDEEGRWIIIDGLQRLNSLKRFFDGEFKLTGLETLDFLNGYKFHNLEQSIQNKFSRGELRIIVLQNDSDPNIKFDIFMRLNQGAVSLNQQELRNCLYRGKLNDLIKSLVKENEYIKILFKHGKTDRMIANEHILRYWALSNSFNKNTLTIDKYDGRIKNLLNDFMKENQNPTNGLLNLLEEKFECQIKKAYSVFEKNAFKTDNKIMTSKINASLFDCVMISFEDYSLNDLLTNKQDIIKMTNRLIQEQSFKESITKATGNTSAINYRLSTYISSLKDVMTNA